MTKPKGQNMKTKSPSVVASKKAMKKMFGNPVGELEDIMTDMFGEGGKEEVKEYYASTLPMTNSLPPTNENR